MMNDLETSRADLLVKTQDLVNLIVQRKKLVSKIQKLKAKNTPFGNFDPEREFLVFRGLDNISSFSMLELLSLSCIMEDQARADGSYPAWSQGEHLEEKFPLGVEQQINPILLATVYPSRYDSLPLKVEFKVAIEKASERK